MDRSLSNALWFVLMVRDFDDNEFPLAYLISYRCYGTWLHGDKRGSVDRKNNVYGTSRIAPNVRLAKSDAAQLKHPPFNLDAKRRHVVEKAIREVCDHRLYLLRALNARTNHVHSVVAAAMKPEPILIAFQAYSTRALRKHGLLSPGVKPWSRHGSTVYLWKERDVAKAIEYVLYGQGDELFRLDDD
jgi:REP element-mobilizing transposase RayT